jgi:MFS family permease
VTAPGTLTAEPAAPTPGTRRNVLLWVMGTGVSTSGDAALWLALSIWVKDLTGSNGQAGLAFLAFIAPRLLTPFTAVLADRLPRRPLVVVLNLVLAGWVSLALLVEGPQDVGLLYLVLVGVGLGSGLHHAAGSALLTRLVPRERLGPTNALLRTVQEVGLLVAPAVGTALYVTLGARSVAIVDAATFLLCAGLVAAVRVREPKAEARGRSWAAELVAGIVHIGRTPRIRDIVVAMGGATLAFGFFESLIFAVADDGLHQPASFVGVATVAKGVGSVLGGLAAIRIVRALPPGHEARLTLLGLGLVAAGSTLLLVPARLPVLAGVAVLGLGIPMSLIGLFTVAQHNTPQSLQGRVTGSASTLVTAPQVVSVGAGAALVGLVDFHVLVAVMAAAVAVAAAYLAIRLGVAR